jgi:hypothetical protein
MTYCWKCKTCGARAETHKLETMPPVCNHGDAANYAANKSDYMVRDYRAEGLGVDRFRSFGDGKVHAEYVGEKPEQTRPW